ncbi:MAG: restriction endonuclease [candidate division Zixibacteria bacterium]
MTYLEQELSATLRNELALIAISASFSLDVVVSTVSPFLDLLLGGFIYAIDSRLRLRALLALPPEKTEGDHSRHTKVLTEFSSKDWHVKTAHCLSDVWCVIMDDSAALVAQYPRPKGSSSFQITMSSATAPLVNWFTQIWEGDISEGLFYEDIFMAGTPEISREIATISGDQWARVISELARNPDLLHSLAPRKFEELVAELLQRQGFETRLTPQTRDGGFDIWAAQKDLLGKHLYLVECKRQSAKRHVGVRIVRALNGVVEEQRASGGIIVTTSRFTKPALQLAETLQYRISLKEISHLQQWIAATLK